MHTHDLDYDLPGQLVATRPVEPRDAARLMVVHRDDDRIEHCQVRDLPDLLGATDLLVFNRTSVAPARLRGRRAGSGGRVEGLLLAASGAEGRWRAMLRSNGRLRPGTVVELDPPEDHDESGSIELVERDGPHWIVALSGSPEALGWTPLPPYILRARGEETVPDARDRAWYQTVYADSARRGSVAAPTAGLHFTPELLDALAARGVERGELTLHVGEGTFKPVDAGRLEDHDMHAEWFEVRPDLLGRLGELAGPREAREARVVAVGTTTVRALESLPNPLPASGEAVAGDTRLLIAPGYCFRHVDALMTNFHLPRSTLLALVAALVGLDRLKALYREAIEHEYRFYSYGDAMLVL